MDRPALDRRDVVSSTSTRTPAATPAPAAALRAPSRPWRCHACAALLGMVRDGELHVKYKDVQHWIRGHCRHACRRCGTMNSLFVAALPAVRALG